jgi:putative transposase
MTDWVKSKGYDINEKRISRLMQKMGIYAITPGPHTSHPSPENKIYPYLLTRKFHEKEIAISS